MAMEDAAVLAEELASGRNRACSGHYARRRKPRVETVVRISREVGGRRAAFLRSGLLAARAPHRTRGRDTSKRRRQNAARCSLFLDEAMAKIRTIAITGRRSLRHRRALQERARARGDLAAATATSRARSTSPTATSTSRSSAGSGPRETPIRIRRATDSTTSACRWTTLERAEARARKAGAPFPAAASGGPVQAERKHDLLRRKKLSLAGVKFDLSWTRMGPETRKKIALEATGVPQGLQQGRARTSRSSTSSALALHDGEFVTIIGPSGCGKSTLPRTSWRLHPAPTRRDPACTATGERPRPRPRHDVPGVSPFSRGRRWRQRRHGVWKLRAFQRKDTEERAALPRHDRPRPNSATTIRRALRRHEAARRARAACSRSTPKCC
jgi:hypothetical protein